MAKFSQLDPKTVAIGRERDARTARAPYVAALEAADAGRIELDRGEIPSTVKRRLADAAKDLGIHVRSSWTDDRQRVLVWKKVTPVGERARRAAHRP